MNINKYHMFYFIFDIDFQLISILSYLFQYKIFLHKEDVDRKLVRAIKGLILIDEHNERAKSDINYWYTYALWATLLLIERQRDFVSHALQKKLKYDLPEIGSYNYCNGEVRQHALIESFL